MIVTHSALAQKAALDPSANAWLRDGKLLIEPVGTPDARRWLQNMSPKSDRRSKPI